MISEVHISGFRGIREGHLGDLKQITILVGRNGVGKSSVLEALYLISACAESKDEVRGVEKLDYVVSRRGGRGDWDSSRGLLWYMGDTEKPIEVRIGLKGATREFIIAPVGGVSKPVRLKEDNYLIDLETYRFSEGIENIHHMRHVGLPSEYSEYQEIKKFLSGILFIDWFITRRPNIVEKYAWPRLLAKRLDKRIVELLKEEFEPDAEGLTYAPSGENRYHLAVQTAETAVRVDDLGDGARAALLASMLVLAYRPTVLLLEEPELHLHPAGMYTYVKFLVRLAKEIGFQIIASTHSLELIQIVQRLAQESGFEASVLYLEREDGVLKARSFSVEDVEAMRKLGFDVRLLYMF